MIDLIKKNMDLTLRLILSVVIALIFSFIVGLNVGWIWGLFLELILASSIFFITSDRVESEKRHAILIGFLGMISINGIMGIITQPTQALAEGIIISSIFYFGGKLFKRIESYYDNKK